MGLSLCITNCSIKIFAKKNVYMMNECDNRIIFIFLLQFDTDVLVCNVDENDQLVVLDTWIEEIGNRANVLDGISDSSTFSTATVDERKHSS